MDLWSRVLRPRRLDASLNSPILRSQIRDDKSTISNSTSSHKSSIIISSLAQSISSTVAFDIEPSNINTSEKIKTSLLSRNASHTPKN